MDGAAHFRTLARYNAWANRRLFDACGQLTEAERQAQRPSFFGSIHATLDHLLLADLVWLSRLDGQDRGIRSLDQRLHADWSGLCAARAEFDKAFAAFVDGLAEPDLERLVRYVPFTNPQPVETPLVQVLTHMVNHGTHHRGQVHGLLSATSVPPPPLDLIYFLRGL